MSQNYDAIVIGGGIIGAWTSLELARRGVERVLLLEKSYPGAGSSGKSSAVLRPTDADPRISSLLASGLEQYSHFRAETGLEIGFREVGGVELFRSASALSSDSATSNPATSDGPDARTILDASALRELEPEAKFGENEIGTWEPETAIVHPVEAVHGCLEAARRQGVEVRLGVAVRAIESEAGHVTGVRLTDGLRVSAPTVVNAAGPWAKELASSLTPHLPLTTSPIERAYWETPRELRGRRTIFTDRVNEVVWQVEDTGWTRVECLDGSSSLADPDHFDEGVSGEFLHRAGRRLGERVPAYLTRPSRGGCAAMRVVTPDGQGIIAQIPTAEGLWVAAGFSEQTFSLAPAIGRGIAGSVTQGDQGGVDPALFSLERFGGADRPAGLCSVEAR